MVAKEQVVVILQTLLILQAVLRGFQELSMTKLVDGIALLRACS
jgi:hypothetical protein